jgi:hypothetical protein
MAFLARPQVKEIPNILLEGLRPTAWGIALEALLEIPSTDGHDGLAGMLIKEWFQPSLRIVWMVIFVLSSSIYSGLALRECKTPYQRRRGMIGLTFLVFFCTFFALPHFLT